MVKSIISACLELAGLGLAAYGLWTLAPWLGMTVGGLGLMAVGTAVDPPRRSKS